MAPAVIVFGEAAGNKGEGVGGRSAALACAGVRRARSSARRSARSECSDRALHLRVHRRLVAKQDSRDLQRNRRAGRPRCLGSSVFFSFNGGTSTRTIPLITGSRRVETPRRRRFFQACERRRRGARRLRREHHVQRAGRRRLGLVLDLVITAERGSNVWVQDTTPDADSATSEGILVFGSSVANAVAVGDLVQVSGRSRSCSPRFPSVCNGK